MKKFLSPLLLITLPIITPPLLAAKPSCPPAALVKQAHFIKAVQHPFDKTCWNLLSAAFNYNGREWDVEFGTFLPTAKTPQAVLEQGQAYFDKSPLVFTHPKPDEIPNHILLCDYMPTGRLYWVSALTPPQYGTRLHARR